MSFQVVRTIDPDGTPAATNIFTKVQFLEYTNDAAAGTIEEYGYKTVVFYDSPSTTSLVRYKFQFCVGTGGGTVYIDAGSSIQPRLIILEGVNE